MLAAAATTAAAPLRHFWQAAQRAWHGPARQEGDAIARLLLAAIHKDAKLAGVAMHVTEQRHLWGIGVQSRAAGWGV